jgi:hypothetical protein
MELPIVKREDYKPTLKDAAKSISFGALLFYLGTLSPQFPIMNVFLMAFGMYVVFTGFRELYFYWK